MNHWGNTNNNNNMSSNSSNNKNDSNSSNNNSHTNSSNSNSNSSNSDPNNKKTQKMVDDNGIAKGMKQVLTERGYYVSNKQVWNKETLSKLMQIQPDFKQQRCILHNVISGLGHELIFLPKFHCELNPIEQRWMHAKRKYKDQNMFRDDVKKLKSNIEKCLYDSDQDLSPKCFKHSRRYLFAYAAGSTIANVVGMVKKETNKKLLKICEEKLSHRRVSLPSAD